MVWTLCTSGSAIVKAGANANSTITASGSALAQFSTEAEALICNAARIDLVTNYASLTAEGKEILSSIASSYIGQQIINYEPEAIGTIGAALRLNLLETNISRGLKQISEDKIKTYLNAT